MAEIDSPPPPKKKKKEKKKGQCAAAFNGKYLHWATANTPYSNIHPCHTAAILDMTYVF